MRYQGILSQSSEGGRRSADDALQCCSAGSLNSVRGRATAEFQQIRNDCDRHA